MIRWLLLHVCVAFVAACSVHAQPGHPRLDTLPTLELRDVTEDNVIALLGQYAALQTDGVQTVVLRINSFGGSVFAGMELIDALEQHSKRGLKTICVADFKAMSMGFVLLQSQGCSLRLMTKRTVLLAHEGSTQTQGTRHDIEESAAFLRALDEAMLSIEVARLKISPEEFRAKVAGRDWAFAWEEALRVGAVDGIVQSSELGLAVSDQR